MNKNYYGLYKDSVLALAMTLVIKSEDTASAMNSIIALAYGADAVDAHDPTTWKYYRNICGLYHPSDEEITIVSLDTLQNITFNRENLTINTATRRAYQYGSRYYNELVSLHPEMEMFILGVLYPADMDEAVAAKDGTILAYPPHLVEEQEVSLISKLNTWIEKFRFRWYNQQFQISDRLYSTAFLGVLYLNLVPAIFNARLAACKTSETHSFHIREYLASHGSLDVYLEHMTLKQALWFYRNIAFIERNNGKRYIFRQLIEHIMTERSLPVSELVMKHDTSSMPDSLVPAISFKRKPLNDIGNTTNRESYSLTEIFAKEKDLNPGNDAYVLQNGPDIQRTLERSLSSVVATKMLESAMIDYTDATPYTLYNIALAHWLAYSAEDLYSAFITVKNPRNGETLTLHCKDAYTYFVYTLNRAVGVTLEEIPEFTANRIQRYPLPTAQQLMQIVDAKYIKTSDATQILSYLPLIGRTVSVDAFKAQTKELFDSSQILLRLVASKEHQYVRALTQGMVHRVYEDSVHRTEPEGTEYAAWLTSKNLPDTDFTSEEWQLLNRDLFEAATGSTVDSTADTRALQKAMLGMMTQLSSYSVQYLSEVNGSNLRVLNSAVLRIGDTKSGMVGVAGPTEALVDIISSSNSGSQNAGFVELLPSTKMISNNVQTHTYSYKLGAKASLSGGALTMRRTAEISKMFIAQHFADPTLEGQPRPNFFGIDAFLAAHPGVDTGLIDIYNGRLGDRPGMGSSFPEMITEVYLDGFTYHGIKYPVIPGFDFVPLNGSTQALTVEASIDGLEGTFENNSATENLNSFLPPDEPM